MRQRGAAALLSGLALAAGLVAGVSSSAGCCGCGRLQPFPTGAYAVTNDDGREYMTDALVTVTNNTVEIDYMMPDGASWRATYNVTERFPDR